MFDIDRILPSGRCSLITPYRRGTFEIICKAPWSSAKTYGQSNFHLRNVEDRE